MSCAPSSPWNSDFSSDSRDVGDRSRKIGRTLQWGPPRRREDCRDAPTDAATGHQCAKVCPAAIDQANERIYLKPDANNGVFFATYTGRRTDWLPWLCGK